VWLTVPPEACLLWFPNLRLCFNSAEIRGNQLVHVGFTNAERFRISWGKGTSYHASDRCVKKARANGHSVKYHGLVLIHEHSMF
jgi:hypothetical protein